MATVKYLYDIVQFQGEQAAVDALAMHIKFLKETGFTLVLPEEGTQLTLYVGEIQISVEKAYSKFEGRTTYIVSHWGKK